MGTEHEIKSSAGWLSGRVGGSEAATIVETALASAELKPVADVDKPHIAVVPEGASAVVLDLDRFRNLDRPHRKQGTFKPATVSSFIDLVEDQADPHTTVWVHPTSGKVVAVLNDHDEDPAYGDYRAELALTATDEWLHWSRLDGQLVDQEKFAEHLEDGVKELVDPDAATMLEIAQSIHANTNAQFRSARRLSDGQVRVQFDETIDAAAGESGQLEIPTEFSLAIAPFIGEDPYRVNARLRYRASGGKLTIGYKLERPGDVVRDALDKIAEKLGERFPRTFIGEPRP